MKVPPLQRLVLAAGLAGALFAAQAQDAPRAAAPPSEEARAHGERLLATLRRVAERVPLVDEAGVFEAFGFRTWERAVMPNFVDVQPGRSSDPRRNEALAGSGFSLFDLRPWMQVRNARSLQFSDLSAHFNRREACVQWESALRTFGAPVQVFPIVATDGGGPRDPDAIGHVLFAPLDTPFGKRIGRLTMTFPDKRCAEGFSLIYTVDLQEK